MWRIILFSILFFNGLTISNGQSNQLDIQIFSFEDGISHRNIFDIEQDSLGLIWIATINGLNQFDGKEFINFNKNDSTHYIPAEYISEISKKEDGRFVLSSPNQVILFDPLTKSFQSITPDSTSVLFKKDFLPVIYYSNDKETWTNSFAQTSNLACIQRCNEDRLLEDLMVSSGKQIHHSNFQFGSYIYSYKNGSIRKKNPTGMILKKYKLPFEFKNKTNLNPIIRIDNENGLWVLFNKEGLYYKAKDQSRFSKSEFSDLLNNKSMYDDFQVDASKNIWIAGTGQFWFFNSETKTLIDVDKNIPKKENYSVHYRKIFLDKQGVIWLATNFGLIKIVKSNRLFTTYLNEKNQYCSAGVCSIRGITGDNEGNVFFSYYNSIHRLNIPTGIVTPLFNRGNFFNTPFGLDYSNNKLWTGNGLIIDWKRQIVDTVFHDNKIKEGVVITGSDKKIWFGHLNQVLSYNHLSKKLDTIVFKGFEKDIQITYLHQSNESNEIFIGTQANGVFKFNKKTKEIESFANMKSGLTHNRILAINEGSDRVWIATADGLASIDANQNPKIYNTDNGLPNNFINGLLPEGDTCLWLSTDSGLCRFDFKNGKTNNFYREDGLPSNEFNRISFYKTKNQMYFGGMKGIIAFSPKNKYQKVIEQQEIPIIFSSFSRYNTKDDELVTISPSDINIDKIVLTHNDKFPTFKFVLPDFRAGRKINYQYLLDGFDRDWSSPDHSNIAKYHNLPAGKYIFRVKANIGQGKWNEKELAIPVTVSEAYYKKWWFILLVIGLALGVAYSYIRYRFFQIKKRKLQLEKEVANRTKELEIEKKKSEKLLLNILPAETARELMEFGRATAKQYNQATVLFSDFKGFTKVAELIPPEELVSLIDLCFRNFDEIIDAYGLEKIKTIGDAYMCAGGLGSEDPIKDVINITKAALDMQIFLSALAYERAEKGLPYFEARIGIHTGPVVAGVVGSKKFAYDIWGDTVNIASRMETAGEVGKINVSATTYDIIRDEVNAIYRGKFEIKNRGLVDMYFVNGLKNTGYLESELVDI